MKEPERSRAQAARVVVAALAGMLVLGACILLYVVQLSHLPRINERVERLIGLGATATLQGGLRMTTSGNDATLQAAPGRHGTAAWQLNANDFPYILHNAISCEMDAFVIGTRPIFLTGIAELRLGLNGRYYRIIPPSAFPPPIGAPSLRQPVVLSPLYQPEGVVAHVGQAGCRAKSWQIEVEMTAASWTIDSVGVTARFIPTRPKPAPWVIVATIIEVLAAFALLELALYTIARDYRLYPLLPTVCIFLLALVTHDQWDFPVWLRFVDLVAFGHANPALMWAGSPLWPYVTSLLSPPLLSSYALFGNGSQEVTALLLKLMLALAWAWNAILTSKLAKPALRRSVFLAALLSPLGLYALAAGYREVLAGLFSIIGLIMSTRNRPWIAALAFAVAGSISEVLMPLILLPAAIMLLRWRDGWRFAASGALCGLFPIALVFLDWKTIPPAVAISGLAFRAVSYRFGGGTWIGALDGLGFPMNWVRAHGFLVDVTLFAGFAIPLLARYAFIAFSKYPRSRDVILLFLGLELAFCLSYLGVDPSTWAGVVIFAVGACAFAVPANPFALVLSASGSLAVYAILGLGDFANWLYLKPLDVGLFGILGRQMDAFILATNFLIVAGWIAIVRGTTNKIFGAHSLWYGFLFGLAALSVTIRSYPEDIFFLAGSAALFAVYAATMLIRRPARGDAFRLNMTNCGFSVLYLVTAIALHQFPGSVAALLLAMLALSAPINIGDVALGCGILTLFAAQPGSGWLSGVGTVAVVALTAYIALRLLTKVRPGKAARV